MQWNKPKKKKIDTLYYAEFLGWKKKEKKMSWRKYLQ